MISSLPFTSGSTHRPHPPLCLTSAPILPHSLKLTHSSSPFTHSTHSGKLNSLLPEPAFGPNMNFIALKTLDTVTSPYGWVLEQPPSSAPADLYTAQKATRAKRLQQPPGVAQPWMG